MFQKAVVGNDSILHSSLLLSGVGRVGPCEATYDEYQYAPNMAIEVYRSVIGVTNNNFKTSSETPAHTIRSKTNGCIVWGDVEGKRNSTLLTEPSGSQRWRLSMVQKIRCCVRGGLSGRGCSTFLLGVKIQGFGTA